MHDVQYYKSIFDKYGGMMRTTQLAEEKIFYPQREKLIADGYVEKIRRGYYHWTNTNTRYKVNTLRKFFALYGADPEGLVFYMRDESEEDSAIVGTRFETRKKYWQFALSDI